MDISSNIIRFVSDVEILITDDEFIKIFGCDRQSYDKQLCENEERILKERDRIYALQEPEYFIGKYITCGKYKNALITDIRIELYDCSWLSKKYSVYIKNDTGKEEWLVTLDEGEFYEGNEMFSMNPIEK